MVSDFRFRFACRLITCLFSVFVLGFEISCVPFGCFLELLAVFGGNLKLGVSWGWCNMSLGYLVILLVWMLAGLVGLHLNLLCYFGGLWFGILILGVCV